MTSLNDMLETAVEIVQRYKSRGNTLPQKVFSFGDDLLKEQENKDFDLLNLWRYDDSRCPSQISTYLDSEMPGWRGEQYYYFLPKAQHIVDYYNRKRNFIAPTIKDDWLSSKEDFQDYRSLCQSKSAICDDSIAGGCPPNILSYLNREAPNWLSIGQCKLYERLDESFTKAEGIVQRYIERGHKLPKEWRNHKHDPERTKEYKDAQKLSKWKETLKRRADGRNGKGGHNCPPQLKDYLDIHMPGWRDEVREKNIPPMQRAKEIVARYRERGNIIPRQLADRENNPDRQQEFKDAVRLKDWKRALRSDKGGGGGKCDEEIRQYLDENMPGWRSRVYAKRQFGGTHNKRDGAIDVLSENHSEKRDKIISITIERNSDAINPIGKHGGDMTSQMQVVSSVGNAHDQNQIQRSISNDFSIYNNSDSKENNTAFSLLAGSKRPCEDQCGNDVYPTAKPRTTATMRPNMPIEADNHDLQSTTVTQTCQVHDDKEISAAAGLVAVYSPRV